MSTNSPSRKYLVTGGAGFIGSHLCEALVAGGHQVVILDDFNDYYDPARKRDNIAGFLDRDDYRLVEGDIRDALPDPDALPATGRHGSCGQPVSGSP